MPTTAKTHTAKYQLIPILLLGTVDKVGKADRDREVGGEDHASRRDDTLCLMFMLWVEPSAKGALHNNFNDCEVSTAEW